MAKNIVIAALLTFSLQTFADDQFQTQFDKDADAAAAASTAAYQKAYKAAAAEDAAMDKNADALGSEVGSAFGATWSSISGFSTKAWNSLRSSVAEGLGSGLVDDKAVDAVVNTKSTSINVATQKKYDKLHDDVAAHEKTMATVEAAQQQAGKAAIDADDAASAGAATSAAAKRQWFNSLYATTQLQSNFSHIKSKFYSIDDAMKMLEKKQDQTVIAAYLQAKVARLLNSDALCKATKECDGGKNKSNFKVKDLKDIFPASTSESMNTTNSYKATPAGQSH